MKNRLVKIRGFYNLRDIGGYPTIDGKSILWGRYLRSDVPKKKSWFVRKKLEKYGVNLIIDIREPHELHLTPDPLSSAAFLEYKHIAMINDRGRYDSYSDLDNIFLMYKDFIDQSMNEIKMIFEALLENPQGCTLLHCTAGKDRTGLITALILGFCRVPYQIIIDDYAMSTALLTQRFWKQTKVPVDGNQFKIIFTSDPANMKRILKYLDETFQGPAGYLEAIGLTKNDFEKLKRMFISQE